MGQQETTTAQPARRPAAMFDVVMLALVVAAFAPLLVALSQVWETVDYYAHGYLVAPVAAAMAWSRRAGPTEAEPRRDARGLVILMLAMLGYGAGLLAGLLSLQGLALPIALAGLALWLRGASGLRRFAFPVAYLVFMVPVPPQWLAPVVTRLQSFVTDVAITFLVFFEVPALREGNVIVLPEGSLFVAEACSGITSIVTLLPVAALLAFLLPHSRRQGVVLMLSVIPVAMFWNLVRVLATVGATRSLGVVRATSGSLHESAGLLTFVMGCLTLLAVSAWLDRLHASPRGT